MTTENEDGTVKVDFADWLSQAPTIVVRKFFKEQLARASRELEVACRESTDPIVRAAWEKRAAHLTIVKYLNEPGDTAQ